MKRITFCLLCVALLSAGAVFAQKLEKQGKAWLDRNSEPASIDVNGVWQAKEWGGITLKQAEGSREVTGFTGDGWNIKGVVSGKKVFLLFCTRKSVEYSAELTAEGEKTLGGHYARGIMTEKSKTKPMMLWK